MPTITRERLLKIQQWRETYGTGSNVMLPAEEAEELARIALASLEAEPVSQPYKLPEEKGASLQLRNLIRKRHAEWSDSTFGNVGPVGPLKHLSKEALEAAAEPGDLSEWADMQFLLWDAQRRAGISDGEITLAMKEKLAVNKKREWPEPKDGEPRLHIKKHPVPEEIEPDSNNTYDYVDGWSACRAAMLQGGEPVSQTYELPQTQLEQVADLYEMQFDDGRTCAFHTDGAKAAQWLLACDGNKVQEYVRIERYQEAVIGNSPVIPDGYALVPVEPTDEMIEAAMNCEDVLFNSDESFCVQFGNIYEAMLAAAPQH
ncbi:DUF550 domain-containing protein [Salmonella enterica]|uniref:DUF550 domain-containing protein n=1 Tax=Salmonella enterica TaxID=28901 RepID=UPI001BB03C61|nr:DUF550 domain-containing protein [Salmonella enterica]